MSNMSNTEFRRLMAYHNAKRTFREFASRSAPSKRSAKNPTTGKVFKNSRIVAMPVEKQFIGHNNYKALNADFGIHRAS